ncbi:MAG TPA: metallophosphoesterase, partial [Aggregatilineales bacterium]|nr:metallophosphoesterase [Aggregatilineales bacterium]
VSKAGEIVREISFVTGDVLRQQIIIDGLEAATTYQYQVLVDGVQPFVLDDAEPWSPLEFTTLPFEMPFRVAAIGDSGFGDDTTVRLVEGIAAQNPDFLLHSGDVVYWMHEYDRNPWVNWYEKYFKPFKPLLTRMPHYPTIGNHEYDEAALIDGIPSYFWMFPPFNQDQAEGQRHWYSFDVNGIQFISLNTQLFYSYPQLKAEQETWLDQKLAREDVLYTVVFCHVALYSSASPHQWDGIYAAEAWTAKFEQNHVALVLSGHAHVYERLELNGVNYIVSGGGSATIYGQGERLAHSKNFWSLSHYPIFDFYEDHIHLTVYSVHGEILDDLDLAVPGR